MDTTDKLPSRSQLMFSLLYSMIPLIGFWVVETTWGLKAGIIVAVVLGILEVAWVYIRERRWEPFAIGSALLVAALGGVSWLLESRTFIYLKPAIFEGIFAAMFLGSSLAGKPFMLLLAKKQFGKVEFGEWQQRYFNGLNFRVGLLFLAHAIITVYAAIWDVERWFFVKGVLFYTMFGVFLALEFVYSRFSVRRQMENMEQQRAFLEHQQKILSQVRRGNKSRN